MEELKLLIGMVSDLPSMALWVLIGYLIYKLAIIGSIFGVIRYGIEKLHDYLVKQKELPPVTQQVRLEDVLHGITITSDDTMQKLIAQIKRIQGKRVGIESSYIHRCSVDWLREAINAKIEQEAADAAVDPSAKSGKVKA